MISKALVQAPIVSAFTSYFTHPELAMLVSLLFGSHAGHTPPSGPLHCYSTRPEHSSLRLQGQCGWSPVGEEGHGREGSWRRTQGSLITHGGGEVKIIQGCSCLSQRLGCVNSI